MQTIIDFLQRILSTNAALAVNVVAAVLAILVTFGITIDDAQVEAIKDLVAQVVAFLAAGFAIRQSVYSQDTHTREVLEALDTSAPYPDLSA